MIVFFYLFSLGVLAGVFILPKASAVVSTDTQKEAAGLSSAVSIEDAVVNVAERIGRAVVSISTVRTEKISGGREFYFGTPFRGDRFSDDFFGRFFAFRAVRHLTVVNLLIWQSKHDCFIRG